MECSIKLFYRLCESKSSRTFLIAKQIKPIQDLKEIDSKLNEINMKTIKRLKTIED